MKRTAIGFNPVYPVTTMIEFARAAERNGYESLWLHESLFQRDAVSYLNAVLSSTSTLKAGSGCVNTVTRHPSLVAASFATLSENSGGRVILGIGLGSFPTLPKIGFQVFPVSKSRPLKRIKEYVAILRALLGGETVNFSGEFFSVSGLRLEIKLQHTVPIYIASLSQRTLKTAPRIVDGAILSPALSTIEETQMKVKWVGEASAQRENFDVASYILTSVHGNYSEAEKAVRTFYFFVYQVSQVIPISLLEPYGVTEEQLAPVKEAWKKGNVAEAGSKIPSSVIEALTLTGSPGQCADRLEKYRKVGVKLPILMPIGDVKKAIESLAPTP